MRFSSTLLAIPAFALAGAAHAAVIDFNDAAIQGSVIDSISSTDGTLTAAISATGGSDEALVFDTTLTGTADPDLEGPFRPVDSDEAPSFDPGGVLIIQETAGGAPDDNAGGGSVTFEFSSVLDFVSFNIIDGATVTVSSEDTDNVATFSVAEPPNEEPENRVFDTFTLGGLFNGVDDLTFTFAGSGAIDDLVLAPIPVPATLPLLLAGVAGLGWASRRRRKAA